MAGGWRKQSTGRPTPLIQRVEKIEELFRHDAPVMFLVRRALQVI
jgi:hypothetical protein